MKLVVVSDDAVSVVYVRLFVELLLHIANKRFVALSFTDCSPDRSLALMTESSSGHASVLT
jgi:hypothetical protein